MQEELCSYWTVPPGACGGLRQTGAGFMLPAGLADQDEGQGPAVLEHGLGSATLTRTAVVVMGSVGLTSTGELYFLPLIMSFQMFALKTLV